MHSVHSNIAILYRNLDKHRTLHQLVVEGLNVATSILNLLILSYRQTSWLASWLCGSPDTG